MLFSICGLLFEFTYFGAFNSLRILLKGYIQRDVKPYKLHLRQYYETISQVSEYYGMYSIFLCIIVSFLGSENWNLKQKK